MSSPNSFTIYDASAGSGKTYTLVKKYLSLLLKSPRDDSYKNILAITFTNKAVAEMKSRIIDGLQALSAEDPSGKQKNLLQDLAEETKLPQKEVQQRSRRILKNIMHNYAAFEVSTIDGFTHRVLRTFAKDLGLPLNFEVELRTEEVLAEAVDRVIAKAGEDKKLTKTLIKFVHSKTNDDKSWDITRDLFQIAKLLTQETSRPFLELLKNKSLEDFARLGAVLKLAREKTEENIAESAANFFDLLREHELDGKDFTGQYCPNFFKKLQKGDFPKTFDSQWQEKLATSPLYPQKLTQDKKDILDEVQPQIADIFEESKENLLHLQFLKAVEKNLVPLSLLSSIQNEIEEIKAENSIVLISEFNSNIGKAVKNQPAPFIYERLGERYSHYFIDEFQDTSELQWNNLIPLVDHSLSSTHPSGDFGSLTLVGDAKQSIYRWRGGKAEQFMALCREKSPFNLEEKELVVLPKNYRSAREIVNFNNDFFKFCSSCFLNENHRELFINSRQELVREKEGYVNISFIEAENSEEEMREYSARVLQILTDLETRNFPKSGICILTRKRKESIVLANFLSEHGIPVISAESLLLSRSPQVCFINSILQFSINGKDKSVKYEILDFLLQNLLEVEQEYQFLRRHLELEDSAFFEALKPLGINFDLEVLNSVSVYEGVEYIIRAFQLGEEPNAYLQFFLDFIYEVSQKEGAGIFQYLELWERKKEDLSIVVPEGEDAVQIMTIHRAKGLEFPVVIYPFANSSVNDTKMESFWMNLPENFNEDIPVAYLKAAKEMMNWNGEVPALYEELCHNSQLDAINVLYVALTRPVQQLYIISRLQLNSKGEEDENRFSGLLISFLKSVGKWDDSTEYHFGNPDELPEEELPVENSVKQERFLSSPTQGNGIPIITRSGSLWDSRQKEAIEKGHLIHDLFARIYNEKDVESALLYAREEGLFKEGEERELKKVILDVVSRPELQQYFSEEASVYNEREMISADGEVLRPDRIVFSNNKMSVIDYKTGAEKGDHVLQIENYARVLAEMNYEIGEKLLIYINEEIRVKSV